jgi:arabinogalactan oligomer/maltooligosaccharide transport system substrate-binding protein
MHVTTRALSRAIAVGAGATLLLTGCGGSEEPTASPSETTTESETTEPAPSESETGAPERADADLVIWADQKRADALTGIAETFGEENGISVAVQVVSQDLQTNYVTANTAENGPDIVIGAHDWIGNLVQNSAIDPINLPEADQAEYSDIALKGVTYEGSIYGLPYAVESLGLYRNTDLVPDEPADLDAAIAAAQASGATNPLCLQVGENGDAYHMQPLYSSAGGYLFGTNAEGDYDPSDLGVGKEGSLAAAAKIGELGAAGVLKTSITGDNSIATFTAGDCAMLVSGPWALADIQAAGINYALGPVPGFAGMAPAQPFTGVQAFYVASNGKNKSFAESFVLDSANTPETMKALYDAEARPPAMTSVLEEVSASDTDTAAFAEAAAGGQILPAIPQMAAIWEPLGKAQSAIVGGADPASTMTSAGTTIAGNL